MRALMRSARQNSHARPARRSKPLSARGGLAGPRLRSNGPTGLLRLPVA